MWGLVKKIETFFSTGYFFPAIVFPSAPRHTLIKEFTQARKRKRKGKGEEKEKNSVTVSHRPFLMPKVIVVVSFVNSVYVPLFLGCDHQTNIYQAPSLFKI